MKHEVWTEGYSTNGHKCEAFCLGTFEGNIFDESVEAYNNLEQNNNKNRWVCSKRTF